MTGMRDCEPVRSRLLRRVLRWLRLQRRVPVGPSDPEGWELGGPDDAGVREPRRPSPLAGAGAVALPEPNGGQ
jgi:hypothetical protein